VAWNTTSRPRKVGKGDAEADTHFAGSGGAFIYCLLRSVPVKLAAPGDVMSKQTITGRNPVWKHGSGAFGIDELTVSREGAADIKWVSFERGDAVAALIVNTDTEQVILIKQFRPPVAKAEGPDHRLVETMAGMIQDNETVLDCLKHEMLEETGYQLPFDPKTGGLTGAELICEFYPSPGGSSEKIHLFYVAVDSRTVKNAGGGIWEQGEFIEPVLIPLAQFFDQLDRAEFKDPKIIIAGQWLQKRWANRKTDSNDRQEFALRAQEAPSGRTRIVGYRVGDIGKVTDVDVWVNSSNTEFLMDSIYHRTLSSRIRTLGAKVSDDVMIDDTIQRALDRSLGVGKGTSIGTVLDTEPGSLAITHNVRRLFHVASIKARIEPGGYAKNITSASELETCVIRALEKCDKFNATKLSYRRWRRGAYRSILLPLFGAGVDRDAADLQIQNLCNLLIPAAVRYLEAHPDSLIEKIYFVAYTPLEVEICDSVMSRMEQLDRLRPKDSRSSGAIAQVAISAGS
jgi:nudix-type nucleoside diphosphatase (YffH/AdpP family)